MEAIFMNTENRQTSEPHKFSQVKRPKLVTNIRHKKFKQTCCSSKFIYLLHMEKHKKTL